MATGIDDMLNTSPLGRRGTLSFQQLTESKNGIERSAELVTHARKEFTLRPVRAVGFILSLLQRLFHFGALGHIVGNPEKCLRTLRPSGRPEDSNASSILANVAINKIRYLA